MPKRHSNMKKIFTLISKCNPTLLSVLPLILISCRNLDVEIQPEQNINTNKSFSKRNSLISVNGYTTYDYRGFKLFVQNDSYTNHPQETQAAISLTQSKIDEMINFSFPSALMDVLSNTPIFIDWNSLSSVAARYNPDKNWLINNGLIPEKEKAIEITNVNNYVNWTNLNQPYMLLHELTHALYHQKFNNNHPAVTYAYNQAIASGKYQGSSYKTNIGSYADVNYHAGNNVYKKVAKAYAITNQYEYFSEITEAYFGKNDYYPFNKEDLKNYDPIGYKTVEIIWKELCDGAVKLKFSGGSVPGYTKLLWENSIDSYNVLSYTMYYKPENENNWLLGGSLDKTAALNIEINHKPNTVYQWTVTSKCENTYSQPVYGPSFLTPQ